MSILMAINESTMTDILRRNLNKEGYTVSDTDVYHRNYLLDIVEIEKPSVLIIHDTLLPSEKTTEQDKEREMLKLIDIIRTEYENQLRIVYLCIRDMDDPFIGKLLSKNVVDIYNEPKINVAEFIEQLSQEPKYFRA